jgi:hypothetical protein
MKYNVLSNLFQPSIGSRITLNSRSITNLSYTQPLEHDRAKTAVLDVMSEKN